ncbi:Shikimate dehydrogenase (NADP(+)) [Candidatus Methanobinarius endosymbioticus]|uniref:Shikimate dehydrogenase (NADP(+)) n=1 Tax=Candidatus Methanobinarius endosymbioticus TaxID=2006182 RepID=A0A366MEE9_9EURY|nr:Shikimate dehydrogenase (NADP(+)) [Candidatus Methanobinarius endosymbioticus]
MIYGTTKVIGVIGDPIEHSFSPMMFNAAFKAKNMDYIYVPFKVEKHELKEAITGAKAFNIKGLNVTIPHKQKVINELDKFDVMANLIGAVNTLNFKDGKSKGYNTDCIGAIKAIEEVCNLKNKNVVIVGAGGAARAIAFQLAIEEVNNLTMVNRSAKKAESLVYDIKTLLSADFADHSKLDDITIDFTHIDLNFEHGGLDDLPNALKDADILIDTTPIGMHLNVEDIPVATKEIMHSDLIVNDIVYNPIETCLLKEAKKVNATCVSGIKMLLYQGAENFKIWTGEEAPLDVMEKALMEAIKD